MLGLGQNEYVITHSVTGTPGSYLAPFDFIAFSCHFLVCSLNSSKSKLNEKIKTFDMLINNIIVGTMHLLDFYLNY